MSKRSGSSQRAKRISTKYPPMSAALKRELERLRRVPDSEIDMTDHPEQLDWSNAVVGKYYRPFKVPISLRLDADMLAWFKKDGKGYQSKINDVLREYFLQHTSKNKHIKSSVK